MKDDDAKIYTVGLSEVVIFLYLPATVHNYMANMTVCTLSSRLETRIFVIIFAIDLNIFE